MRALLLTWAVRMVRLSVRKGVPSTRLRAVRADDDEDEFSREDVERSLSPRKLSKGRLLFRPNEANGLRLRCNEVEEDDDVLDKAGLPTEPGKTQKTHSPMNKFRITFLLSSSSLQQQHQLNLEALGGNTTRNSYNLFTAKTFI